MNIRLFSKTYHKDFPWLRLAIETVIKHCKDKVFWTIVVDGGEEFNPPNTEKIIFNIVDIRTHWPEASELGVGYVQQQWVKMNAHRVMGQDYFLNWDSDVMALREFGVKDFQNAAGKPILWFTPFNDIINGDHVLVHTQRQNFIKKVFNIQEAPFEWMRCMPIWLNGDILRVGASRKEWLDVQLLMKLNAVDGLSEFNIIGQLSQTFFPDAYDYKNTNNSPPTWAGPLDSTTAIVGQCWSWGGKWDEARQQLGY